MTDLTRYPLCWPAGWKRTPDGERKSGKFRKGNTRYNAGNWQHAANLTIHQAVQRVRLELDRMDVRTEVIISTNVETTRDGTPRSDRRAPADPGVCVYWDDMVDGRKATRCMAVDLYSSVADNLAAIAATLDAMRAIERHGGSSILDRAFTGFTALPAPGAEAFSWRDVLGLPRDEKRRDVIQAQYRRVRSEAHPDRPTGSAERFTAIEEAWQQALQEIGS